MPALNSPRASWHVWAPPVGEVKTLSAKNPSGWPAGTRLVVGASDADLLADAVSLGAAVLSEGDTIASWALDLDACALLRAAQVFALQVPSGEAWEGVAAGAVLPEPLWRGQASRTQALGTVTTGPQGHAIAAASVDTSATDTAGHLLLTLDDPSATELDAGEIPTAMVGAVLGVPDPLAPDLTLLSSPWRLDGDAAYYDETRTIGSPALPVVGTDGSIHLVTI